MALSKVVLTNLALSKIGSDRLQITNFDTDTTIAGTQARLHYDQTLEELTRMHSWNCCKKQQGLSPYRLKLTSPSLSGSIGTFFGTATTPTSQPTNSTFTGYAKYDFNGGFTAAVAGDNLGATLSRTAGSATTVDNDKWQLQYHDGSSSYTITKTTNSLDPSGTYTHAAGDFVVEKVQPTFGFDCQFLVPSDLVRALYLTSERDSYRYMKPRVDWVIEGNVLLCNYEEVYLCYEGIPEPTLMDSLFAKTFYTMLAMKLAVPVTGDRELEVSLLEEINGVILPEARRVNGFERLEAPTLDSEWLESTLVSPSSLSNSWPPFSQTSYGSFE